jgi:hypothetical protein
MHDISTMVREFICRKSVCYRILLSFFHYALWGCLLYLIWKSFCSLRNTTCCNKIMVGRPQSVTRKKQLSKAKQEIAITRAIKAWGLRFGSGRSDPLRHNWTRLNWSMVLGSRHLQWFSFGPERSWTVPNLTHFANWSSISNHDLLPSWCLLTFHWSQHCLRPLYCCQQPFRLGSVGCGSPCDPPVTTTSF